MGAVNDITIMYGFIAFFVLLGGVLPFVTDDYASFGTDSSLGTQTDEIIRGEDVTNVNALQIFRSIITMFFWTFGELPFFLDLILFVPLRFIFAIVVARNIWSGGGG